MFQSEMSSINRRKKIDVPIHNAYPEKRNETHKRFGANFNSRKKHKNVEFENNQSQLNDMGDSSNLNSDLQDQESVHNKLNRKQLNKEIDKLRSENLELIKQLNNSESVSVKKITKLREKLNVVNTFNSQAINENQILKNQYEQLMKVYEDLKIELEEARKCKSCEDLKTALENSVKDYGLLRATNKELLEDIDMLKNVVYR